MTATMFELKYCTADDLNRTRREAFAGRGIDSLLADGGEEADAVYGYALGGHTAKVNSLVDSAPHLLEIAAQGYARAKNTTEVEKLMRTDALKASIIFGHAQAGNEDHIRAALSAGGDKYLADVIRGLASTGKTSLLLRYIDGKKPDYFLIALRIAAKGGHKELVDELLKKLSIDLSKITSPIKKEVSPYLKAALAGYGEGRHFTEAVEMMELGVFPISCLTALAGNGRLDRTEANLLVSMVKDSALKTKISDLIEEQFGFTVEEIDADTRERLLASIIDSGERITLRV